MDDMVIPQSKGAHIKATVQEVKEFERDYHWHGKPPSKKEAEMALKELRTLGGKIKSEHQ